MDNWKFVIKTKHLVCLFYIVALKMWLLHYFMASFHLFMNNNRPFLLTILLYAPLTYFTHTTLQSPDRIGQTKIFVPIISYLNHVPIEWKTLIYIDHLKFRTCWLMNCDFIYLLLLKLFSLLWVNSSFRICCSCSSTLIPIFKYMLLWLHHWITAFHMSLPMATPLTNIF